MAEGSGKPKAEILKLDGTQIDKDGNVTQTDFFKFLELPAKHAADLEVSMSPEQALTFRNHIIRMKVGTSAMIPMLCGGPKCPVKQCPFHEGSNWPTAKQCPLESNLVAIWTKSYVEDLEVDVESRTEMILINQLVECDIIDYRANIGLSKDEEGWTLIKTDIIPAGDGTFESTSLHPLLEAKDRAQSKRMKILEALGATRREKYKKAAALKQRDNQSVGQHWAEMKEAIKIMNKAQQGGSLGAIKADADSMAMEDVTEADWEMNNEED